MLTSTNYDPVERRIRRCSWRGCDGTASVPLQDRTGRVFGTVCTDHHATLIHYANKLNFGTYAFCLSLAKEDISKFEELTRTMRASKRSTVHKVSTSTSAMGIALDKALEDLRNGEAPVGIVIDSDKLLFNKIWKKGKSCGRKHTLATFVIKQPKTLIRG